MSTSLTSWYVVQTQPRAEAKALAHLQRQGFDVYMPRFLKQRRHARKIDTVAAPLFPGYLFVAIDLATQRWRAIHSTVGVSHLISDGDRPRSISGSVIRQLRERQGENGFIKLDVKPPFAAGDRVRVLHGALTDCLGLFEEMPDQQRVAVLLNLLGRQVRVLVDVESIAAA